MRGEDMIRKAVIIISSLLVLTLLLSLIISLCRPTTRLCNQVVLVKGAVRYIKLLPPPLLKGVRDWKIPGVIKYRECVIETGYSKGGKTLKGMFNGRIVRVYLWGPLVLFSIYPMIAFYCGPYRRYRRRKKGLCLNCGYNLTGNVSGVCPECGEGTERKG
jgi:hypothetical protein